MEPSASFKRVLGYISTGFQCWDKGLEEEFTSKIMSDTLGETIQKSLQGEVWLSNFV